MNEQAETLRLLLTGDVMLGRGIDQVLPRRSDPVVHEPWVNDARAYVELAEARHGKIDSPVGYGYVWGALLDELERAAVDVRIVNLETSVTTSDDHWPGKGIHYRMHPGNVPCLTRAAIDCCVLANNHVLDWGHAGLVETLRTLQAAGLDTAGAGVDARAAAEPAVIDAGTGRLLVFAYASPTSGTPSSWAATSERAGINVLSGRPDEDFERIAAQVAAAKRAGDIVVVSVHWGDNWGCEIPSADRRLARRLIEEAGIDVIHGHSSHHPKGIECCSGKLVLYGCGDLINDYEGIAGWERYRGDLSVAYLAALDAEDGTLVDLELVPFRMHRFRLQRAAQTDVEWLATRLDRECRALGGRIETRDTGRLAFRPGETR